jgi:GT2 family glycosyltransferase
MGRSLDEDSIMSSRAMGKAGIELKRIDIIIVNYNSTHYLLKCLASVHNSLKRNIKADIHVIDNASVENADIVKKAFPGVMVHKNRTNVGFARAVNQCMAGTSAPYILILNPDTIVDVGFFESMLAYMSENPHVAVAGPRIMEADGMTQGSARAFPTPLTALFGRNALLSRVFPHNPLTRRNVLTGQQDMTCARAVDWVSGACMMVRRKAVCEVGMLDGGFFMYWEDADWCKRMSMRGWRTVYVPGAVIVHYVGGSCKNGNGRLLMEFHKSAYRYFCKHSPHRDSSIAKMLVFGALSLRFYMVLAGRFLFGRRTDNSAPPHSGKRPDLSSAEACSGFHLRSDATD